MPVSTNCINWQDFAEYNRTIVNNLGYFAISRSRAEKKRGIRSNTGSRSTSNEDILTDTSSVAKCIYWLFFSNTAIKSVFLAFLVLEYFGPVEFLDKIAALDYILCVCIVLLGSSIWFFRYPLNEIFVSFWKVENSIFAKLGYPADLKEIVDKRYHVTVWIHLCIVWFGCSILVSQFYEDPKYCAWTYSAFQLDTWYLRFIFCLHEFFFMMHAWNNMTGSCSLCTFQGIALSNIINRLTAALQRISEQLDIEEINVKGKHGKMIIHTKHASERAFTTGKFTRENLSVRLATTSASYNVNEILFHYKQLMIICDQFNYWVSYKIVFLHACGYCQFISDVFVAMQVLKIEGTGIMDVWFYIEDSLASMYMIYRVYKFMSRVKPSSDKFLHALRLYLTTTTIKLKDRRIFLMVEKTLRPVSLNLGPCPVTPMTVLQALNMLANYYLCVALWN